MLHSIRLPLSVRINQLRHHEPIVADTVRLRDGKRVTLHGLDGAPHVDDLHAVLEEVLCVVGEVEWDAGLCRFVRLVDVHALYGAAEFAVGGYGLLVWGLAPDGVIEDVDAGRAGAGAWLVLYSSSEV